MPSSMLQQEVMDQFGILAHRHPVGEFSSDYSPIGGTRDYLGGWDADSTEREGQVISPKQKGASLSDDMSSVSGCESIDEADIVSEQLSHHDHSSASSVAEMREKMEELLQGKEADSQKQKVRKSNKVAANSQPPVEREEISNHDDEVIPESAGSSVTIVEQGKSEDLPATEVAK